MMQVFPNQGEKWENVGFQKAFKNNDPEEMAYVVLVALDKDVTLHIWEESWRAFYPNQWDFLTPFKQRTIKLKAGEAICFRGDLIHSGN